MSSTTRLNPRTAGGLSHLRTAAAVRRSVAGGGGGSDDRPPPENSKTKKDSEKRYTELDRPWQVLQKYFDHFLIKSNLTSQGVKKGEKLSKSDYFRRKSQLS